MYNVKEGWKPLCKFLGKEIPDKPFPHENIAGRLMEDLMARHPAFVRIKYESFAVLSIIAVVIALGIGAVFL